MADQVQQTHRYRPPCSTPQHGPRHQAAERRRDREKTAFLWSWARNTAWRHCAERSEHAKIKRPARDTERTAPRIRNEGHHLGRSAQHAAAALRETHRLSTTSIYATMGPAKRQLCPRTHVVRMQNVTGGGYSLRLNSQGFQLWKCILHRNRKQSSRRSPPAPGPIPRRFKRRHHAPAR